MLHLMEIVFTFKSTHDAIHGERALLEAGLPVKVMALPSSIGAGCGLCLRIAEDKLDPARRLFDEAGIVPQGTYRKETENGKITYSLIRAV